jgi:hypothetical protein
MTRFYYFNVKATESHDEELAIIEAKSLVEAIKEFGALHPEDIENIESITSDADQNGTDAQIEVN